MEDKNVKPLNNHVIIIAPPFQGHINPSIQLALKLASKGFTVTFVNTHWTHHQITKARKRSDTVYNDIFTGSRKSGLEIRYKTIGDGFPLTFDRSNNHEQFMEGRIHVFPAHVDELIEELAGTGSGSDPPPTCLVADSFETWGSRIARKYGLVFVSLWTEPGLVLTLYYHMDLLKKNGHYGSCYDKSNDQKDNTIDYVPGVKTIKHTDLMSYFQESDTSKVMHRLIDKAFADAKRADILICNTIEELEPKSIAVLKQIQPAFAIGPLFPALFDYPSVEMNLWSEIDCTTWLDTKPRGSVLYASFGSFAHTNREIVTQIANGLIASGVSFIWVLRPGIVSSNVIKLLPDRFEEKVGDRGLVVPWCKQNEVLSHCAVGGFLTHCGWNSILESIWCGVPMICYPLIGDQMTNRKLVVDDWKIGINLCEGGPVSSNEVADKIRYLMTGESVRDLRNAIEDVRKKLKNALCSNGSSHRHFEEFVENLKDKIQKHKK